MKFKKEWPLGFIGIQGVPALMAGDWANAIWVVWFVWFVYFVPRTPKDE